jgi:hypothetical protein
VRTSESQVFAQKLHEQRAALDFAAHLLAINGHGNNWHEFSFDV